jgi:hypothetical protein
MQLPPFKWPLEERQWEQVYRKITALLGIEWGQVSKSGSNLTDITTRNHADLQNINTATYTHLTETNHTDLTDSGDSALHYHDTDRDRDNHTGTQLASTISDFDVQVATTAALKANNLSDLSNAATARTNIGLGNVDNTSDINKPVSTAQAAADAAILASAESYADGLVVGLVDDRGNYDASGNVFPSSGGSGTAGAILKGDLWTISISGTLGGHAVTPGDLIRALVNTPGATDSNWAITENNIGYVAENSANKNASGGYAGLTLFNLNLINALGTVTSWFSTAATVARTWTLPDHDGTILTDSSSAGSFPTLNQNTTGSAASLTTARTINGVSFNGTANIQTATANTSDYETDAWTPIFTSDSGSISCSTLTGLYTKIGNQVTVTAKAVVSSVSTPGGNVNFGNFPFPTATGVGGSSSASVSGYGFESTMTTSLIMPLDNNSSTFNIFKMNGAGSVATLAADIKAGTTLFLSAKYITN